MPGGGQGGGRNRTASGGGTPWQSPISPGISFYEAAIADRPVYPALDGSRETDVVVIGGGFTGLRAAYGLAKGGVRVTLIDGCRFGDGASGRNGGQLGTGQRVEVTDLAAQYGLARAKALFALAEDAKRSLLDFAQEHGIDMEYQPGHLSVTHKARDEKAYRAYADLMRETYAYPHMHFMDARETADRLGSRHYVLGLRDSGTGHIQPMALVIGLARAAAAAGADLFELTRADAISVSGGRVVVETPRGTLRADRALIACNAHIGGLEPVTSAHVMPIRSFIGATAPVEASARVLPGGESVADSRFVVRYFRKSRDGRLLFGGREAYTADEPHDMSDHIRRGIAQIYPQLSDVAIDHAWGGSVGITLPRQPFVRQVMPGVTAIGGYSGHGVMLANHCGKLYADRVLGRSADLDLLEALRVPPFPGGRKSRSVLLFLALTWYALRDKL